jgi:hypothetical protein
VAPFAAGRGAPEVLRAKKGADLRDVVASILTREPEVTRTSLKEKHTAELRKIGITTRWLDAALKEALDDGLLVEVRRRGRGGGMCLVPVTFAPATGAAA